MSKSTLVNSINGNKSQDICFINRFFEWETLKGGKKQPYYIYFKNDGKLEAKTEGMLVSKDGKSKVEEMGQQPDADVCIKDEQTASITKVKEEDVLSQNSCSGTKRLLTMAGLFDHWQAPKVNKFFHHLNRCNFLIHMDVFFSNCSPLLYGRLCNLHSCISVSK